MSRSQRSPKRAPKRQPDIRTGRVPRHVLHSAIVPHPYPPSHIATWFMSGCFLHPEVVDAFPAEFRDATIEWFNRGCVGEPPIDLEAVLHALESRERG
jgi:hypothetical protein